MDLPVGIGFGSTTELSCFTKLPFEIILEVAIYLPTSDFLRL